ncbi:hypothetical protein Syun_014714 [Stephania yunnanensis]|uniref:FACT complex subunit n=1 Tax=Stephania yunnanensis TaxID=152371 RepID=A0AAP0P9V8_9MAGN
MEFVKRHKYCYCDLPAVVFTMWTTTNPGRQFYGCIKYKLMLRGRISTHNDIMVGNSRTKNIQFRVEVMDAVQTLGGARSTYDPDEIEEEQREREMKNRTNLELQNFVEKVNDLWRQPQFRRLHLEFEMALRELGFPRDFKKKVCQINSIPSTSLDGIKEWFSTINLKHYESKLTLMWQFILKTITDDPRKFVKYGCWDFLNADASDSDSENSEDSDRKYEPSNESSESDSDDEDDDIDSMEESDETKIQKKTWRRRRGILGRN